MFVKDKFEQTAGGKKNFFVHLTCAIDTASVRSVFDSVLASIIHCSTSTNASADTTTGKLLV